MNRIEAQELLVPNPLLYSDMKKYIWISDSREMHKHAQLIFDYLLKRNIYIIGFVTDKKVLFGLKMFNKPVCDIDTLDEENIAIFFDPYFTDLDISVPIDAYSTRIINPELDSTNVVIWGSGITGEHAYNALTNSGINVKYFVDSNRTLEGGKKFGLPIYAPDRLEESGDDITIIEAMTKWEEVDERIQRKYRNRFYYSLQMVNIFSFNDRRLNDMGFRLGQYWVLFHYFQSNKVYIYGLGASEKAMANLLKLLDFDFLGFLIDEDEQFDVQYSVKFIEDALYEEDYYIWVYDVNRVARLHELGFVYFKQYICQLYFCDLSIGRKNLLDINLAHSFLSDSKYPGFEVYGEDTEDAYKIAVLGNSTTDGGLYPFKSWPELLQEKLGNENITIYNGGVCGYTSGQEIIKLIRDVLRLEPNMIIVYDGTGELAISDRYPFSSAYAELVYDYANAHIDDSAKYLTENEGQQLCRGIMYQGSRFDNWLSNIRTMHAIASDRNISFFSLCSPTLASKRGKMTTREKNMLLSVKSYDISRYVEEDSFRKSIEQLPELPDYMYDLSHIFDGWSDIYMDISHVWEKGNEIIAEEVKKIILPILKEQ